jgi:hypothetical protein
MMNDREIGEALSIELFGTLGTLPSPLQRRHPCALTHFPCIALSMCA